MIFVGEIEGREYPRTGSWPFCQYARLFADSREELLAFAGLLHLNLSHLFITRKKVPVFFLTVNQREKALDCGAAPLSMREANAWFHSSIWFNQYDPEATTRVLT